MAGFWWHTLRMLIDMRHGEYDDLAYASYVNLAAWTAASFVSQVRGCEILIESCSGARRRQLRVGRPDGARLALPMAGIGIITMLSQLRGAYARWGAVAATFAVHRLAGAVDIAPGGPARADPGCRWRRPWSILALAGWRPARMATGRIDPVRSAGGGRRHAQHAGHGPGALECRTATSRCCARPCAGIGAGRGHADRRPAAGGGAERGLVSQAGPLAAAALLAVGITAFSLQTRTALPLNPARAGREPTVLRGSLA